MSGKAAFAPDAVYDILIMDADGQHLQLEVESVHRRDLKHCCTCRRDSGQPLGQRLAHAIWQRSG